MQVLNQTKYLLRITGSNSIARRYFVVNGFDGALTMLGLIVGFAFSSSTDLSVIINACMGAAIALGVSGFSSAYISESAERKHALRKLQQAMVNDLQHSAHAEAARWVPWLIALVNGLAPFVIALLIIMPMWLSNIGFLLPLSPLYAAISMALVLVFLLGVFLGRIANIPWFHSGIRTLAMAILTVVLIYFFIH